MEQKFWLKALKPYMIKSNSIALRQILLTLIPYFLIWAIYIKTLEISPFLVIPLSLLMSAFVLRSFVLMHDCGHGALFQSARANQFFGFLLGVLTGMPQYVWSKHHAHHHATNGDWEKYQGPLSIITTKKFAELNQKQQRNYQIFRHPLAYVLLGGFLYVLFNPRFNWMLGSLILAKDILKTAVFISPAKALRMAKEVPSKKWKSPMEFRHMTYNNIALLSVWYFMCQWIGAYNFFIIYASSLSLAGGLGILFFTVQHNFEHSYASDSSNVNRYQAALKGTSYLKLSKILNWLTADIAYHHIHHLSTAVPNYQLALCHAGLKAHFHEVKRISLKEIPHSLKYLLWDTDKKILVTIAEARAQQVSLSNLGKGA